MTDGNGVWSLETLNNLRPGLHRVTVENGTTDREFFLFRPTDTYLPPAVFWLLLALIISAAALSLYDRRAVVEEESTNSAARRRVLRGHIRRAAAAAAILLGVAGLMLVWYRGAHQIARVTDGFMTGAISEQIHKVDVEGEISALADGVSAFGLDVSAGDTTIRIAEGSRFRFAAVDNASGLRLNHPRLLRTVVKSIDGAITDIPFSADLYNNLIRIVDAESRGKLEQVLELADERVSVEISRDLPYRSIFNLDNVPDQELFIGKIELLPTYNSEYGIQYGPVVRVEAINGEQSAFYHFAFEGGQWLYIR
jgi:hypothetical protein